MGTHPNPSLEKRRAFKIKSLWANILAEDTHSKLY